MDQIYGNVCVEKPDRHRASQTTMSTKALVPLCITGGILLLGVIALGALTYTYASQLSSEQKRFVLLEAQYVNLTTESDANAESRCKACPGRWLHYRGKCYIFSTSKNNWEQSRNYCITLGGHLAIVNDKDEQGFLVAQTKSKSHWIGLNDMAVEGEWRWVDNSLLNQTGAVFWVNRSLYHQVSEPDNWKGGNPDGENCGCISQQHGDWQDNSCEMKHRFVCEMLGSF